MRRFLARVIDIRPGEWGVTLLMFTYLYLLLVTYYFLKPARDSLFLVKLGPEQLPLVFILIAVIVVPITTLYSKASRSFSLNKMIIGTTGIIIINLFILRYLLTIDQPWVFYTFYVWVSIYGILTTSQFWLMANAVYDASQAKRIFVPLGVAAILGAFTGGQVTSIIVSIFGVSTEDLLLFCVGFLIICVIMVHIIWRLSRSVAEEKIPRRSREKGEKRKESVGQIFATIKDSRHLMLIVGILTVTMMVATFVDFQFKTVSSIAFDNKEDLTSFLGAFYSYLSLAGLFLQLILSYRFLRILGVGGVIMFLPLGLLLGSVVMLVWPGLMAGVLLRGADGAFKYSIDKTGRELLFLPVPLEIKKRTKMFIDMFIDRWSRGVAGAILIGVVALLPLEADPSFSLRMLSIPSIVLIAIWIVFILMIRKEYINAFRNALERREININEVRVNINDASTVNTLIASLGSQNERQVIYALEMLKTVDELELVWPIAPLLEHKSIEVRRKAVQALQRHGNASVLPQVEKLLEESDCNVRRDAMQVIARFGPQDGAEYYRGLLASPDNSTRCTAVAAVAAYGDNESKALVTVDLVAKLIDPQTGPSVEQRRQIAGALGQLGRPELSRHFEQLLADDSSEVVREAMASVGRLQVRQYVPWLILALGKTAYRAAARDALIQYGTSVLGTLYDYLTDQRAAPTIRRHIPRVVASIPHQRSVDLLTGVVGDVEPQLKFWVVKALNRLRKDYPEFKFNEEAVDAALLAETKTYYEIAYTLKINNWSTNGAGHLLKRALIERQDENLERMFRLLGLHYPAKDIYSAYQGIVSPQKTLRASAIEFLDNILKADIKRYLYPIIDQISEDDLIRKGHELFGVQFESAPEALEALINGRDPWLRACALYYAIEQFPAELSKCVETCREDPDPIVRETASLAGRRS